MRWFVFSCHKCKRREADFGWRKMSGSVSCSHAFPSTTGSTSINRRGSVRPASSKGGVQSNQTAASSSTAAQTSRSQIKGYRLETGSGFTSLSVLSRLRWCLETGSVLLSLNRRFCRSRDPLPSWRNRSSAVL